MPPPCQCAAVGRVAPVAAFEDVGCETLHAYGAAPMEGGTSEREIGMSYDGNDPTCLVGEELNMVCFVMDYVEFRFNGPILRSLSNPTIEVDGGRWTFPQDGSRDALCKLIGVEVQSVDVTDDRIELVNRNNARLTIPLDAGSRLCPEAAQYVPARADGSLRGGEMIDY